MIRNKVRKEKVKEGRRKKFQGQAENIPAVPSEKEKRGVWKNRRGFFFTHQRGKSPPHIFERGKVWLPTSEKKEWKMKEKTSLNESVLTPPKKRKRRQNNLFIIVQKKSLARVSARAQEIIVMRVGGRECKT